LVANLLLNSQMKLKKHLKRLLYFLVATFILINIVAFMHAYKFTHFTTSIVTKTDSKNVTFFGKIKMLLLGVNNPRPTNIITPTQPYQTLLLQSNKTIECWLIKTENAKGTVVVCHGYSGNKSSMLDKSDAFINKGYNILLVDFMGSGGSEGNQTTIGFKEAEEVQTCYNYLDSIGEKNIHLFGTSLGAVAIMRAISVYNIKPKSIILECPFGTMLQTTQARFKSLNLPLFPMANLLVFWGGVQNDFWAFSHKPIKYAKSITCPTLLLYGEQDDRVSRNEIDEIFTNLAGPKTLKTYPNAGHENYLKNYEAEWLFDVGGFLKSLL
jgi:uncharacterized protein